MPTGVTCSVSPAAVTPSGAPVTSTVSILTTTQSAFVPNHAPPGEPGGRLAFGWVMPWGFISLLGLGRARKRSRIFEWSFRVALAAVVIAGSLFISGCGGGSSSSGSGSGSGSGNSTTAATPFTLTIISTAPGTPAQNVQITVNVQS
jgi:hypothetical protein